jgi:hypothetical protein
MSSRIKTYEARQNRQGKLIYCWPPLKHRDNAPAHFGSRPAFNKLCGTAPPASTLDLTTILVGGGSHGSLERTSHGIRAVESTGSSDLFEALVGSLQLPTRSFRPDLQDVVGRCFSQFAREHPLEVPVSTPCLSRSVCARTRIGAIEKCQLRRQSPLSVFAAVGPHKNLLSLLTVAEGEPNDHHSVVHAVLQKSSSEVQFHEHHCFQDY